MKKRQWWPSKERVPGVKYYRNDKRSSLSVKAPTRAYQDLVGWSGRASSRSGENWDSVSTTGVASHVTHITIVKPIDSLHA